MDTGSHLNVPAWLNQPLGGENPDDVRQWASKWIPCTISVGDIRIFAKFQACLDSQQPRVNVRVAEKEYGQVVFTAQDCSMEIVIEGDSPVQDSFINQHRGSSLPPARSRDKAYFYKIRPAKRPVFAGTPWKLPPDALNRWRQLTRIDWSGKGVVIWLCYPEDKDTINRKTVEWMRRLISLVRENTGEDGNPRAFWFYDRHETSQTTGRKPEMPWLWDDSKGPKGREYHAWEPAQPFFLDKHDRRARLLAATHIEQSIQAKALSEIFNIKRSHNACFERLNNRDWWHVHVWIEADQKPPLPELTEVKFGICRGEGAMPKDPKDVDKKGLVIDSSQADFAIFVRAHLDPSLNGQRRRIVAHIRPNLRPVQDQIKALDQADRVKVFGDLDPERRKKVFGDLPKNAGPGFSLRQTVLAHGTEMDPKSADYFELDVRTMSELSWEEQQERLGYISKHFKLDKYQSEALKRSTIAIPQGVHLIKGPPGTGKTRSALVIILTLASLGIKVLVSAGSNKAVDNLTHALYKAFKEHRQLRIWCGLLCRFRSPSHQIAVIRKESASQHPIRRQGPSSEVEREISKCQIETLVWQYVEHNLSDDKCRKLNDLATMDRQNGLRHHEELALKDTYGNIMGKILEKCRVVATTLSNSAQDVLRLRFKPDFLVCDESGQCLEGDHMIAMTMESIRSVTLIGDPDQLPPTVISEGATNEGALYLKRSLMARLANAGYPMTMLSINYRANSNIMEWYNRVVSKNQLAPGPENDKPERVGNAWDAFTTSRHHFRNQKLAKVRRLFISVIGQASRQENGTSWHNRSQAEITARLLSELYQDTSSSDRIRPDDVMILSPYKAQCQMVEDILGGYKVAYRDNLTIDASQGQEAPMVVYLITKPADKKYNVGFIGDFRRLNVAMSRAQKVLVIVGNLAVWDADFTGWLLKNTRHKPLGQLLLDVVKKNHVLTWADTRTVTEIEPAPGYEYVSHVQPPQKAHTQSQPKSRSAIAPVEPMEVDDDSQGGRQHETRRPPADSFSLPYREPRGQGRSRSPHRTTQSRDEGPSRQHRPGRQRSPQRQREDESDRDLRDRIAGLKISLREATEERRRLEWQMAREKEERIEADLQDAEQELQKRRRQDRERRRGP